MLPSEHMRTFSRLAPVTPIKRFALVLYGLSSPESGISVRALINPPLVLLYATSLAI
jgi:hypothetical protein